MIAYTLGLIRQGTRMLLLNRQRSPWMGCWNGVGGKLEPGELPEASMRRELLEETGIGPESVQLSFRGLVTWSTAEGESFGGMYLYLGELAETHKRAFPQLTDEGILDWKEIDWILDPRNQGVASNVPLFLRRIAADRERHCFNFHSIFDDHLLLRQYEERIDPCLEYDGERRAAYLRAYIQRYTESRNAVNPQRDLRPELGSLQS